MNINETPPIGENNSYYPQDMGTATFDQPYMVKDHYEVKANASGNPAEEPYNGTTSSSFCN